MFARVFSHNSEIELIDESLWAKKALLTSFVISLEIESNSMIFSSGKKGV
jgi:hypothetical protein